MKFSMLRAIAQCIQQHDFIKTISKKEANDSTVDQLVRKSSNQSTKEKIIYKVVHVRTLG